MWGEDVTVTIVDGTHDPYDYFGTRNNSVTPNTLTTNATSGLKGLVLTVPVIDKATYWSTRCLSLKTSAVQTDENMTLTAPDGYLITGLSMTAQSCASARPYKITVGDDTQNNLSSTTPHTFTLSGISQKTVSITIQQKSTTAEWFGVRALSVTVKKDPAYVSELSEVNPNKCYTVTPPRSAWAVSAGGSALTTIGKLGLAPSKSDTKQQFAFVTPDEGNHYYLYCVGEGKYLTSSNTLTTDPTVAEPVYFADASSYKPRTVRVYFNVQKNINVNGNNVVLIDNWTTADDGCAYLIEEAADFDPTDALEIFNTTVSVTYNLYESDGATFVSSAEVLQEKNSDVSIPSSLKSVVSSFEANDYDYATSGTIGTEDCTITVTRTLKSDQYVPSLPSGLYLNVGSKATTMTAATSANDNDHWYLLTQTRGGESPVYDVNTYTSVLYRAASSVTPASLHNTSISGNEKYLVRFIETGSGTNLYYIQFANGNYVASNLKTAQTMNNAGTYAFYRVTSGTYATDYTFGWNKNSNAGDRVDNNSAGNTVSFWGSGVNDGSGANNVWTLYPVEFVSTVEIAYTLTDQNQKTYSGTYRASWNGDETAVPSIPGAYGATFSNKVFSDDGGYSLTADIDFGFPVSSNSVDNPTAIRSALGNSLWYAKDDKVIADNKTNTTVYDVKADYYRWYIYPIFNEGEFYFALYNVGARKYIPNNPSTNANTATTLTDVPANVGGFQFAHYNQGNGFYDKNSSKFLTINTAGTAENIWLWSASSSTGHRGSVMSFPELTIVSVSETFAALKNATKFDILEGSTVMGPSEFDAPASINAAIDAANDLVDPDTDAKIAFIESENGTMIQNYLDQVAAYGDLSNIQFTMSKEYGTLILPCPCTRIDGLDIYSCSGRENNTLTLTPVEGNYNENVPYIIHATERSKYTIIGWDKGSTSTHTSGWLTGVLNSETDIPSGSYMLATNKTTGVQAFYKVSGSGVKCAINKCYLTVPVGTEARTLYLDIDGEITAIEEVFGDKTEQGAIYNLAGQRLTKAQKGINIINGKKVIK